MSSMSRPRATVAAGLTLGATAASIFLAPSAFAAEVLPAPVGPASVAAGTTLTFEGTGCVSTETDPAIVYTDLYAGDAIEPLASAEGDLEPNEETDGAWAGFFALPADLPAGSYEIESLCETYTGAGDAEYETYSFMVTPAGSSTPAPGTATPAPSASPTMTPAATPAAFKPGAKPNTPGVSSTASDKTTGAAAAPGQKVVKVLKGFQPFEKVTVVLHSDPVALGEFTADANGVVTVEFTVPAGTPLGNHTIAYTGDKGTYFEEALQLTADGKALAYTGASIAMPLIGGSVLLAAGAGAMVVGRRRRTAGAIQA